MEAGFAYGIVTGDSSAFCIREVGFHDLMKLVWGFIFYGVAFL